MSYHTMGTHSNILQTYTDYKFREHVRSCIDIGGLKLPRWAVNVVNFKKYI